MLQNIMLFKTSGNINLELTKSWLGTILTCTGRKTQGHIISNSLIQKGSGFALA